MTNKSIVKIIFLIIITAVIYTGCSKNDNDSESSNSENYGSGNTARDLNTVYCLACHGGSYDALADSTADLYGIPGEDGWQNPHRSAHGTDSPCSTCHDTDDTGQQNTRCSDKTVMISTACSDFCHAFYTVENPYPDL